MTLRSKLLPALMAAALLASGSALAEVHFRGELIIPPVVVAPAAPPAVRVEPVPPPPGPPEVTVWEPGHWEWNGRGYFWVGGHYVERPEVGLVWEPGRWVDHHDHWEWIGGHWRR